MSLYLHLLPKELNAYYPIALTFLCTTSVPDFCHCHGFIFSIFKHELGMKSLRLRRGSCCSPVGKAVASDTRDPQLESSHRQILFNNNCKKLYWKDEYKVKGRE